MNVAILHYHLERGGVTRVIVNHLQSLDTRGEPTRVRVLHGGRAGAWPGDLAASLSHTDVETVVVPGFDYDEGTEFDAASLGDALLATLRDAEFDPRDTVLHVHNHSLGKNLAFPIALRALIEEGYGALLHVHDFAEDFRPANYGRLATAYDDVGASLYPTGPRVHYAALNRRDLDILDETGVPAEQLHFLPNPVPPVGSTGDRDASRALLFERFGVPPEVPYLLYPVRGIRRKNVGEAVLWAAVLGDDAAVGITLTPLNPVERGPYESWRRFAEHLVPTMRFGVGDDGGLGFTENLAAADAVLVTSIAEGFGMAFLEPWTFDRPLLGRNLPEITADFVDEGLSLAGLYDRLDVPVDWIGRETFATAFREAARNLATSFGVSFTEDRIAAAIDRKLADGLVDFGDLDETMQKTVVRRVVQDVEARRWLRDRLPSIPSLAADVVATNRRVVEERFSPESCGRRLHAAYERILAERRTPEGVGTLPTADGILESFLDLDRLRLLRC